MYTETMDATKILTPREIQAVLTSLHRLKLRSPGSETNLAIFRLSCCCGLRRSEIAALNVEDITWGGSRPCINLRKDIVKGKRRARRVPLWWDQGTFDDLKDYCGDRTSGPFIIGRHGGRIADLSIANRWRTALKPLGKDRQEQLTCHCGRHSFCTYALAGGRTLPEVRDAAGHKSISTTNIYAHVLENGDVPDLFSW